MKRLKVRWNLKDNTVVDRYGKEYHCSDYKDIEGLLENIDHELERYELELCVGDHGDDNYWICIGQRRESDKLS